ncbi:MAG TPA: hypothetical protein VNM92_15825 [Thermoanaerobaculia bacterium]|nr:hypothetical protein [Thermoanaerobaculia bacterium]
MGVLTWVVSALLAALLCRLVPAGRPLRRLGEFVVACVVATMAGLLATALDFAGWNEPDWRAALFCFLCALAAVGILRMTKIHFSV